MDSSYCWMEVWNEALWLYQTVGLLKCPLHPILYNFVNGQISCLCLVCPQFQWCLIGHQGSQSQLCPASRTTITSIDCPIT